MAAIEPILGFLSALALVMLTLVGYASGITAVGRHKQIRPEITDLLIVVLLWIGAFLLRDTFGKWGSILFWLIIAFALAALLTAIRHRGTPMAMAKSELPEHAQAIATQANNPLVRGWQAWSAFATDMGDIQGRMLMGYFYFIVVTPFGLGVRMASDPLTIRQKPIQSGWQTKDPLDTTIEAAQEQG